MSPTNRSKKNVKCKEYWTVKYSNYTGPVYVVEYNSLCKTYECVISRSDQDINERRRGGYCRFKLQDFRKKITQEEFLRDRIEYMSEYIAILNKKLYDQKI